MKDLYFSRFDRVLLACFLLYGLLLIPGCTEPIHDIDGYEHDYLIDHDSVPSTDTLDTGSDTGEWPEAMILVYTPPNSGTYLSGVRLMKVSVSDVEMKTNIDPSVFTQNKPYPFKLDKLPFGDNIQIEVQLCKNTCDPHIMGDVIARGYSIPFSLHAGDKPPQVFVYTTLVDTFSPTFSGLKWKESKPPVTSLLGSRWAVLHDGRVLITGGATTSGSNVLALKPGNIRQVFKTAIIYDPNTNTFTTTPKAMVMPRAYHTMTLLPDGRVLICGGFTMDGAKVAPTKSCETFDPETKLFQILPKKTSMQFTRAMHTASLISNTRPQVLFAGGKGTGSRSWEVLDIDAGGTIAYGTLLTAPRWNHTATLLQNYGQAMGTPRKVIALIGGENDTDVLDTVDVIDLDCNLKRQKVDTKGVCLNHGPGGMQSQGPLQIPGGGRTWHASVYVPSRQMIYVIGGFTKKDYSAATNRIDVFREQQGDFFSGTGPNRGKKLYQYLKLDSPLAAAGASLQYRNGLNTILITGGIAFSNNQAGATDNASVIAEVLSSYGGVSLKVAPTKTAMPVAIAGHQSVMLITGKVLIFGGINRNSEPNPDAYLYTFY